MEVSASLLSPVGGPVDKGHPAAVLTLSSGAALADDVPLLNTSSRTSTPRDTTTAGLPKGSEGGSRRDSGAGRSANSFTGSAAGSHSVTPVPHEGDISRSDSGKSSLKAAHPTQPPAQHPPARPAQPSRSPIITQSDNAESSRAAAQGDEENEEDEVDVAAHHQHHHHSYGGSFAGDKESLMDLLDEVYSDTASMSGYSAYSARRDDTEPINYYIRLVKFYQRYNPEKLGRVEEFLSAYRGEEEQLFSILSEKYGPEPKPPSRAERDEIASDFGGGVDMYSNVSIGARVLLPKVVSPGDGNTEYPTPFWPGTKAVRDTDLLELLLRGSTGNKHLSSCFLGAVSEHPKELWNGLTYITRDTVKDEHFLGHQWSGSLANNKKLVYNGTTFDRCVLHCSDECTKEDTGAPVHERWRLTMYQLQMESVMGSPITNPPVLYRTVWDPLIHGPLRGSLGGPAQGYEASDAMFGSGGSSGVMDTPRPVRNSSVISSTSSNEGGKPEAFTATFSKRRPPPPPQPKQPEHGVVPPVSTSSVKIKLTGSLQQPELLQGGSQPQLLLGASEHQGGDSSASSCSSSAGSQASSQQQPLQELPPYQQQPGAAAAGGAAAGSTVDTFISHLQALEARMMGKLDTALLRVSALEGDVSELRKENSDLKTQLSTERRTQSQVLDQHEKLLVQQTELIETLREQVTSVRGSSSSSSSPTSRNPGSGSRKQRPIVHVDANSI